MLIKTSVLFLAVLVVSCAAHAAAPAGPSAADARAVLYQWNPENFHPPAGYPAQPVAAPGADGTRVCIVSKSLGYNHFVVTKPGLLKAGHDYTAVVRYEVVKSPEFPDAFFLFARSRKLGIERDCWRNFLGEPGVKGVVTLPVSIADADDWTFYLGCKGRSAIIVDTFTVVEGLGYTFVPAAGQSPAQAPAPTPDLPAGSAAFTIEPPRAAQAPVAVSTADYGLVADPPTGRVTAAIADANLAALKQAIAACRTRHASTLLVPKGVYRFGTKEPIPFENLSDVTIDGQGSEFIFETLHTGTSAMSVKGATRCVVKNLMVDWDWSVIPLASLAQVVAVQPDGLQADLAFPDLSPAEVERLKHAPWLQMMPMDPKTFRLTSLLRLPTAPSKFETVAANTLRVTFKQRVPLVAGQHYCVRHLYYEMGAFRVGDCSQLLFENVTIYSIPGMGWVNRDDLNHWGLRNCRIVRRPGTRRPLSTAADGFHVLESQGYLLLDGCEFSGSGDDSVNIHDNCAEGTRRVDATTLTLVGNTKFRLKIAVGDTIELRHADFAPLGYISKVLAVQYPGNDTTLTVADPLPAGLLPQSIVLNQRYDTANVRIANCHFHDTAGRGILLSARDATLEHNVFDHTRGTAIDLETEIVGTLWAEGHGARNIVIRNNQFLDANTQGKFDGSVVYACPMTPAGPTGYPLFSDILVAGNHFVNCVGPAVSMTSCRHGVVTGNRIESNGGLAAPTALSACIKAAFSSAVTVTGNTWQAGAPSMKAGLLYDPETCTEVTAAANGVTGGK